ncbi:MAG: hypothetical protein J6L68_05570 [Muribaculaceae bacterium]|uniref:hypothetical protein n=1 Tax=uncultured Duncaniella sp. TaxID=2768039 RepID=UPI001B76DFCB|nr:hypothetical protein [uncultured Duncaniella sp.]MBP3304304.1 hypothetical protein [Muribaculaceae bacterium]
MKKTILYTLCAIIGLSFAGCSDSDEVLEPTGQEENFYKVPDDATGPEADMRRKFYNDTKVNLLFSDVLKREYVGKDAFGEDVWKENKIDFRYNVTSYNEYIEYGLEFLESDQDKSRAVELMTKYLMPHFGEKLRPFSILVAKSLTSTDYNGTKDIKTVNNVSCRAIAVGDIMDATDAEAEEYFKEVCKDMLNTKVSSMYQNAPEFEEFRQLSGAYLNKYISSVVPEWDGINMSLIYNLGYIGFFNLGYPAYDMFYMYGTDDFNDFFNLAFDYSVEEVEEMYGDYPKVMVKYNSVKDAFISVGYVF